jgi:anhydro-N-acetylmuramic acid kinase
MLVIGLISGTSMDAIDAALVELKRVDDALHMRVRAFAMLPYNPALRERLVGLLPPHAGSTAEVCALNVAVGEAFAAAALALAEGAGVPIETVDLIGSHGQTVYHQVAADAERSTLQIGAPAVIAERTGCTVVADFRPRDMAAGGQGAPLVPYLDALLFHDDRRTRAVQNIGGIGNVTYLPPNGPIRAFDTGPGNVLIDEAVQLLTNGRQMYDHDGRMAAAGRIDEELLAEWLDHPFFRLPPPRSTGRELFGVAEAHAYVAQGMTHGLAATDIVATITALTAWSIADTYQTYCAQVDDVLLAGGGARNPTLVRMICAALPQANVRTVDALGLNADAKEAVAFAVTGYATLHGWPNNIPEATGAHHPVVLGSVTPGRNYRALLERIVAAPSEPARRIAIVTGDDWEWRTGN